jgi:hypothetical protein
MGGQGHCKHAKETGGRMLLHEYKRWSLRAKLHVCIFFETVAVCVEKKTYKNCKKKS